jgi:hypothetical protein
MTRFTRSGNGKYVVHSKSYDMLIGTRAQVWHGTAYKTSGGLTKAHIMQNKNGRIVSRSKHSQAKKDNRLVKSGYGTKKGTFGFVKLSKGKSKRGGAGPMGSSSSNTASSGSNSNAMKAVIASQAMNNNSGSTSSSGIGSKKGGAGPMNSNNTSSSSSSGPNSNMAKLAVASQMSNSGSSSNTGKRGGRRGGGPGSNSGSSGSNSSNMMKMAAASKMSGNSSGPTKGGRRHKGTRKMRGGMYALSPHTYNGKGVGTSGVDVQFAAGSSG